MRSNFIALFSATLNWTTWIESEPYFIIYSDNSFKKREPKLHIHICQIFKNLKEII